MTALRPGRPAKISVLGAGYVGSTFAYALMISGLASEIVVVDVNARKAEGEALDLSHGVPLVRPVVVRSGTMDDMKDSDIVAISAGTAQRPGETRLDLVHRNAEIFRKLIPQVAEVAPDSILLVVTNPVDVMTYLAYKFSGFPQNRVLGSGTALDTSRFRYLLSLHCGISARNVHAYIIGEHGDSEVAVWSLANIAGMRLAEYCPLCERACDPSFREDLLNQVRRAAYEVIDRKGATNWAIGLAMTEIVGSILRNENVVMTVSSLLHNYYGADDVCLSVPAVLNRGGVARTVPIQLDQSEQEAFLKSASIIKGVLKEVL
ncbi:MAG TPA: L-lactate dehydrogenase [Firmicutes bacterium]|nr:L-lactate dehydrogenase [Bacillota bacterium]